ncbi:hypothetical protein PT974_06677 [Cladobotryum mycophilum]|uniref:Uncharacterized protein n=1 Tax=Cladobotryum mycophilum TaxID=491253 RepID=A0ABR0SMB3_9HYPO
MVLPLRESSVLPRIRRFHVQVRLDNDVNYDRLAVAKAFSGLRELSVELVQSEFLGAGYDNLTRFEDVRGVGRVTIWGSTTGFEDYVCWLQGAMMSEPGAQVPAFEASDTILAQVLNARLGSHN